MYFLCLCIFLYSLFWIELFLYIVLCIICCKPSLLITTLYFVVHIFCKWFCISCQQMVYCLDVSCSFTAIYGIKWYDNKAINISNWTEISHNYHSQSKPSTHTQEDTLIKSCWLGTVWWVKFNARQWSEK